MTIVKQAICTFIMCFLCMNVGFIYAWPSSTIQIFSSNNTILNRPMSPTEQALFGSLFAFTAVICTPFSCILLNVVGTKYSCLLFALPQVVFWALISISTTVEMILTSICISGMGGCLFAIVPLFISEISQDCVRGTMVAGVNVFYGTGITLSYVFGGYLSYQTMNHVCLVISIVGILLLIYVKESPTYLLRKGLDQEAAKSIAFYRSIKIDDKEVLEEIDAIQRTLRPVSDVAPDEETLKPRASEPKQSVMQFIKKSKSTLRGIFVVLVLTLLSLFQGLAAVQVYAEPLFQKTMPNMSGNLLSIFFGLLNTIMGFTAAFLVDMYGRRALMLYSAVGTSTCWIALASLAQLQWGPHWLNVVFLYLFCAAYTFGAGTIPYIIMAEFFLPEVKSFMMMIAQEWAWICNFLVVFLLSILVSTFGLTSVFYMFATSSVLSVIFSYYYLPETKALSVDIIQTLLTILGYCMRCVAKQQSITDLQWTIIFTIIRYMMSIAVMFIFPDVVMFSDVGNAEINQRPYVNFQRLRVDEEDSVDEEGSDHSDPSRL